MCIERVYFPNGDDHPSKTVWLHHRGGELYTLYGPFPLESPPTFRAFFGCTSLSVSQERRDFKLSNSAIIFLFVILKILF